MVSSPSPPFTVSFPEPAYTKSFPSLAFIMSSPAPAITVALLFLLIFIVSDSFEPTIRFDGITFFNSVIISGYSIYF